MRYGSVPQDVGSDLSELEYGEYGDFSDRGKVDFEGGNIRASKRVTGVLAVLAVVVIGIFGYASSLGGGSSVSSSRSSSLESEKKASFATSSGYLKERREASKNFKETKFNLKISATNEYGEYKGLTHGWRLISEI